MGDGALNEWGGVVPTVARPEVEFQGSMDEGQTWFDIPFRCVVAAKCHGCVVEGSPHASFGCPACRYKPDAVDGRPPFVAPHQPRLDWQMWYMALVFCWAEMNPMHRRLDAVCVWAVS